MCEGIGNDAACRLFLQGIVADLGCRVQRFFNVARLQAVLQLIVEIGLTSGGIDKVGIWRALGAKEVWVWQNAHLQGFAREADDSFVPITQSRLLAGLELSLVEEFASVQPVSLAKRGFRERLEARG